MTKTVYFDTNVFDHIHKKIGVTDADLLTLRSAVKASKLSILLSILNIEETVSVLKSNLALAIAELQLILELADWSKLVKPPDQLLRNDMSCYARGRAPSEPFVVDSVIQLGLRALQIPSQQDIFELLDATREIRKQKEEFMAGMREARKKVLAHVKELKGRRPNFDEYWERLAEKFAEGLAEHESLLETCSKRGIKGLLDVRSMRLYVGASLSLAYAETFEGRTPKIGDSRDLQHAVLAAAADMFVTQDENFAKLLARIPIEGFQVMNLHALLKQSC